MEITLKFASNIMLLDMSGSQSISTDENACNAYGSDASAIAGRIYCYKSVADTAKQCTR